MDSPEVVKEERNLSSMDPPEMVKEERKRSKGQKKIKMEKIKDKARLQVTFAKRRRGLFKKASELSVLCGAEIALIVFSPAGKAYVCGHPTTGHVLDRFLNNGEGSIGSSRVHHEEEFSVEQRRCVEVEKELEVEKKRLLKRGKALDTLIKCNEGTNDQLLWDAYIDGGLGLEELEQMRIYMEELKKIVEKRVDEVTSNAASSSSSSMTAPESAMTVQNNDDVLDDYAWDVYPIDSSMFGFNFDENTLDGDCDPIDFSNTGNDNLLELEWWNGDSVNDEFMNALPEEETE